jgi:hypothetical protein
MLARADCVDAELSRRSILRLGRAQPACRFLVFDEFHAAMDDLP